VWKWRGEEALFIEELDGWQRVLDGLRHVVERGGSWIEIPEMGKKSLQI